METAAIHARIRVLDCDHYASNAGLDHGVGAGRGVLPQ
jgi:hypothetical protein